MSPRGWGCCTWCGGSGRRGGGGGHLGALKPREGEHEELMGVLLLVPRQAVCVLPPGRQEAGRAVGFPISAVGRREYPVLRCNGHAGAQKGTAHRKKVFLKCPGSAEMCQAHNRRRATDANGFPQISLVNSWISEHLTGRPTIVLRVRVPAKLLRRTFCEVNEEFKASQGTPWAHFARDEQKLPKESLHRWLWNPSTRHKLVMSVQALYCSVLKW